VPTIVGMGGLGRTPAETRLLDDYALGLARGRRVTYLPTARGDAADAIVGFYARYADRTEASHLSLFPWPSRDPREALLGADVVLVAGGNTANALAIWRAQGLDALLREAWEGGTVLAGASAGFICWFEAGITDSFGPDLTAMRDGLGFLPGSACPHYDGEERRRPVYRDAVAGGFPPGIAADDGVAVRFSGAELAEVVACRDGAAAYRVGAGGEERLAPRLLT
jgi:peptidase E